jgi:hypothetical protein
MARISGSEQGLVLPDGPYTSAFREAPMSSQSTSARIPLPSFEVVDVPGFPGYRVGDDGSVWSNIRRLNLSPRWRRLRPVIFTARNSRETVSYQRVSLRRDKKTYLRFVHRLVLILFVGPCPPGKECCHNDGNSLNNDLENLRWDTKKANQADRKKHGTYLCGHDVHNARLTEAQVREIRRRRAAGETLGSLGDEFGVDFTNIYRICSRKTWRHVK